MEKRVKKSIFIVKTYNQDYGKRIKEKKVKTSIKRNTFYSKILIIKIFEK